MNATMVLHHCLCLESLRHREFSNRDTSRLWSSKYHQGWSLDCYNQRTGWRGWLLGWGVAWRTAFQFWGLGFALIPLCTCLLWTRNRVGRAALLVISLQFLASAAVCWIYPHYLSPAVAWLVLTAVLGLRHLPAGWRDWSPRLAAGLIGVQLLMLWATTIHEHHRSDPKDWVHRRLAICQQLTALPGKHLVIVHYSDQHNVHEEWVYNAAELEESRLLWARGERPEWREQLFQRYSRRRSIWELRVDDQLPPRLVSRPDEPCSANVFRSRP